MRLWVLSDLHLEHGPIDLPKVEFDVAVLAGDIHARARGLHWIRTTLDPKPVIYVLGNHELYRDDVAKLPDELRFEARGSAVHVLENQETRIGDVIFLGAMLWTDWRLYAKPVEHARIAEGIMNDFTLIREHGRRFTPDAALKRHVESVAWLEKSLDEHRGEKVVVVTHHAPSPRSVAKRFAGNPLTPAFVSDLEPLIERSGAKLWVHGHVHDSFEYRVGATRVLCNPRGYVTELNPRFNPTLVVDV